VRRTTVLAALAAALVFALAAGAALAETFGGTSGNGTIYGTDRTDRTDNIRGLGDGDRITGKDGDDQLDGSVGPDRLYGDGYDTIYTGTSLMEDERGEPDGQVDRIACGPGRNDVAWFGRG
jgi:Ca2+-binding RTX toxin-like protein